MPATDSEYYCGGEALARKLEDGTKLILVADLKINIYILSDTSICCRLPVSFITYYNDMLQHYNRTGAGMAAFSLIPEKTDVKAAT